jgi:hypothetical protein
MILQQLPSVALPHQEKNRFPYLKAFHYYLGQNKLKD